MSESVSDVRGSHTTREDVGCHIAGIGDFRTHCYAPHRIESTWGGMIESSFGTIQDVPTSLVDGCLGWCRVGLQGSPTMMSWGEASGLTVLY